jgi:hypothetical protein
MEQKVKWGQKEIEDLQTATINFRQNIKKTKRNKIRTGHYTRSESRSVHSSIYGTVVKCISKTGFTNSTYNLRTPKKPKLVKTQSFFTSKKLYVSHKYLHLLFLLLPAHVITINFGVACSHYITRKFLSKPTAGTCEFYLFPTHIWVRAITRVTWYTTTMPTFIL